MRRGSLVVRFPDGDIRYGIYESTTITLFLKLFEGPLEDAMDEAQSEMTISDTEDLEENTETEVEVHMMGKFDLDFPATASKKALYPKTAKEEQAIELDDEFFENNDAYSQETPQWVYELPDLAEYYGINQQEESKENNNNHLPTCIPENVDGNPVSYSTETISNQQYKVIRDQILELRSAATPHKFENIRVENCDISAVCMAGRISENIFVEYNNCHLENCYGATGATINVFSHVLRDVSISNVKVSELWLHDVLFDHVTIKGKFKGLFLIRRWDKESLNSLIDLYKDVDLALDVSEAQFTNDPGLTAIPAWLIKYNPEYGALITHDRLKGVDSNTLEQLDDWATPAIMTSNRPGSCFLLVVPTASRQKAKYLEMLELLRNNGWVEPSDTGDPLPNDAFKFEDSFLKSF